MGTISEAYPHLILDNLTSPLGGRIANILKHLFPVPKEDSKRVITFANRDDYISFRHHTYTAPRGSKSVEIKVRTHGGYTDLKPHVWFFELALLHALFARATGVRRWPVQLVSPWIHAGAWPGVPACPGLSADRRCPSRPFACAAARACACG